MPTASNQKIHSDTATPPTKDNRSRGSTETVVQPTTESVADEPNKIENSVMTNARTGGKEVLSDTSQLVPGLRGLYANRSRCAELLRCFVVGAVPAAALMTIPDAASDALPLPHIPQDQRSKGNEE